MSSTKIVIIVLILLAVLFVVGVGVGVHFNGQDEEKARCCEKPGCERKDCSPGWVESIGSWLDALRPRLELPEKDRNRLSPIAPSATVTILIPAAESSFFKSSLRMATFRLVSDSRAALAYDAQLPEEQEKLRRQCLILPRTNSGDPCPDSPTEKDDPRQGTLVITEKGGTLKVACIGLTPCRLELK